MSAIAIEQLSAIDIQQYLYKLTKKCNKFQKQGYSFSR